MKIELLKKIKKELKDVKNENLSVIINKFTNNINEEEKISFFRIVSSIIFFEIKNSNIKNIIKYFVEYKLDNKVNEKVIDKEKLKLFIALTEKEIFQNSKNNQIFEIFLSYFQKKYFLMINYFNYIIDKKKEKILKKIYECKTLTIKNTKIFLEIYFGKNIAKLNINFSLKYISEKININKFKIQNLSLFEYNILKTIKIGLMSFDEKIQKITLLIIQKYSIFFNNEILLIMLEKEKFVKFPELLNKEQKIIHVLRGVLIYSLESDNPLIRLESLNIINKLIFEDKKVKINFFKNVAALILNFYNDEDVLVRHLVLKIDNLMKIKILENNFSIFQLFENNMNFYEYLLSEDEKNIRFQIYVILNKFKFEKNLKEKFFLKIIYFFQKNYFLEKTKKFEKEFILENLYILLDRNKVFSKNLWLLYKDEFEKFLSLEKQNQTRILFLTSFYFFSNIYEKENYFFEEKFFFSRKSKFFSNKYLFKNNFNNSKLLDFFSDLLLGEKTFLNFLNEIENDQKLFILICLEYLKKLKILEHKNFIFFIFRSNFFKKDNILQFLIYLKNEFKFKTTKKKIQ